MNAVSCLPIPWRPHGSRPASIRKRACVRLYHGDFGGRDYDSRDRARDYLVLRRSVWTCRSKDHSSTTSKSRIVASNVLAVALAAFSSTQVTTFVSPICPDESSNRNSYFRMIRYQRQPTT